MADYDRVRYAQGAEPPLSFDRRAAAPRGGPAPVTLILSLLLLAGVGGGVFYMYRSGLRGPGDAPRPVGAPIGEVRTAAPPQAATPDPGAGLTIYKDDPNAATAVPAFVPPPEQPSPRPATAAPAAPPTLPITAAALPPSSAAAGPKHSVSTAPTTGNAAASAHAAVAQSPRPASATSSTTVKSTRASVAAAKTLHPTQAKTKATGAASIDSILADPASASAGAAKAQTKAKAKAASMKAATDGGASVETKSAGAPKPAAKVLADTGKPPVVQIGAYSSRDLAEAGWSAAAGAAPTGMSGKVKHVVPLSKADGSKLYRTSVTGFASREEAVALCAKLKAGGQSCFVR